MLWGHSQEGAFVGSSFVKTSSTCLIHVKAPPGSSLDIGFSPSSEATVGRARPSNEV
jgi:hypothetical protein